MSQGPGELRPILHARRRRLVGAALGVAVALHVAVLTALAVRGGGEHLTPMFVPVPTVIAPAPAPPPVVEPVPQATAMPVVTMRAACPPVRGDAPPPGDATAYPLDVGHVTTATSNAGWVAAWSESEVYASSDAGRTFERVLDGPGHVRDVAFDCYGDVLVLRGATLGIRDGDGQERWRAVPGIDGSDDSAEAMIGGGPDVIVIGATKDEWRARLAVSPDLGATWWFRDLAYGWEQSHATGHEERDGTIFLALTTADCMSDPVAWYRIKNGSVEADELASIGPVESYGEVLYASYEKLRWKRWGGEWHDVTGIDREAQLVTGPTPRAVADQVVYRLDRGRAKALRPWPERYDPIAVDLAGRLWGMRETIDGEGTHLSLIAAGKAPIPPRPADPGNE